MVAQRDESLMMVTHPVKKKVFAHKPSAIYLKQIFLKIKIKRNHINYREEESLFL